MPGWLPTAIIANILAPDTERGTEKIKKEDIIQISETDGGIKIVLPAKSLDKNYNPTVPPIEIIDGQHRLWAFEKDENLKGSFELPVVAFYDLDISWQAYLFYTINIKPKKINASLAFDLYPILRVQEWLERSPDGAFVYKETRAQELVEALWTYKDSMWRERINMLGETKTKATITQAAYIRNLIATFIKTSTTMGLGGLFGAQLPDGSLLYWNRTQQAAFLIFAWNMMQEAVKKSDAEWATSLREYYKSPQGILFQDELDGHDPAIVSKYSLLATDQGVRGFLHIINDMMYVASVKLELNLIPSPDEIREDRIEHTDIQEAVKLFKKSKIVDYLTKLTDQLSSFEWRTSSTPSLSEAQRQKQMIYKGSSGYSEIRRELLKLMKESKDKETSSNASFVLNELGYANK